MALVKAQCTNCGGKIEVNSEAERLICKYCGMEFVVQDAINTYNTNITNINNVTNSNTYNIDSANISMNSYDEKAEISRARKMVEVDDLNNAREVYNNIYLRNPENREAVLLRNMGDLNGSCIYAFIETIDLNDEEQEKFGKILIKKALPKLKLLGLYYYDYFFFKDRKIHSNFSHFFEKDFFNDLFYEIIRHQNGGKTSYILLDTISDSSKKLSNLLFGEFDEQSSEQEKNYQNLKSSLKEYVDLNWVVNKLLVEKLQVILSVINDMKKEITKFEDLNQLFASWDNNKNRNYKKFELSVMDRVFWSNNKINEWKFKDSKYHTDEEKIMAKEAQYNEKYRDSIYYLQKKDYDEDHDVKYIYPMNDERYLKSKKIIYEYSYNEFKKRTLPKNNEINGEFKEIDNLIKYYEKEGLTQYISNDFYETLEKTKETKKVFDNYGQVYTITISNLSKQIEIAHKKEIRKTIVSTTILIVIIAMIILFFKFFKK